MSKHQPLKAVVAVMFAVAVTTVGMYVASAGVNAASVASYIDLAAGSAPYSPSTITTPAEEPTSTADEFYISYTTSATEFESGDVVHIYVPAGFTSVGNCSTATTDADGDTTADGSMTWTGDSSTGWTGTYTFTAATTTANSGGVEFCFSATTPSTVGNYSVAISDDNDNDSSAAMIYVGDDNDVTVTAYVPTVMSLRIKEASSTSDTNSCDLGTLNPASVNTCSYRLAAGTNHAAGMHITLVSDDDLNQTTASIDIDKVVDGSVTAGQEEYGLRITDAGAFTVENSYDADHAIPSLADGQTEETIASVNSAVDDSNTSNWVTILHSASVNSATAAGNYDQVVTYRVYADN